MALAGCSPSVHDMGNQLYFNEKGIKVLFSLSTGFDQDTYFFFVPVTIRAAKSVKVQQE